MSNSKKVKAAILRTAQHPKPKEIFLKISDAATKKLPNKSLEEPIRTNVTELLSSRVKPHSHEVKCQTVGCTYIVLV